MGKASCDGMCRLPEQAQLPGHTEGGALGLAWKQSTGAGRLGLVGRLGGYSTAPRHYRPQTSEKEESCFIDTWQAQWESRLCPSFAVSP